MAYLTVDAAPRTGEEILATAADFSAIEWRVIRLARRDGRAGLASSSRLQSLLQLVTGQPTVNKLADQRLETLRTAAARLWHSSRILDQQTIDALLNAGFSFTQVALLQSVCDRRD